MFTGIIKEIGTVTGSHLTDAGVPDGNIRLTFHAPLSVRGTSLGDSIAVNGACLTVTDLSTPEHFSVDVMPESLRLTTLGTLRVGSTVNLETALPANARLDGHIVQGHVDGVARLEERVDGENWTDLRFSLPQDLSRYVAHKGSISVSGVSLTVTGVSVPEPLMAQQATSNAARQPWFSVSLIPTTLAHTTLGSLSTGDRVNIEVDVIAKYVERLLGHSDSTVGHANQIFNPGTAGGTVHSSSFDSEVQS